MSVTGRPDEIGVEPSRRSRLGGAVLAALLVLGLAAVALERWESRRQLDALLQAATRAEQVVQESRRSLGGLAQYSGGLLARSDLGPAQRAAVLDTFAVDARRFPPRVADARAALDRVRPLPWDDELADARAACLARIDVWTAFVEAAQAEPDALLLERQATRAEREAAARAVQAAADGRAGPQVAALTESLLSR